MFKLVWKDILVMRLFLLPAAFSYLVFLLMAREHAMVMLIAGIFLTVLLTGCVLGIETVNRTEPLFAALPLARRDIVAGRYLSAASFNGLGLLLFLAGAAAFMQFPAEEGRHLSFLLTAEVIVAFLVAVFLLIALFFPLYFRYDLGKGLYAFSALLVVLYIVLTVISRVLGNRLTDASSPGESGNAAIFISPYVMIRRALYWGEAAIGTQALMVCLALSVGLVYFASFRVSTHFYSRRDL